MKKVLFVATVVRLHINLFHLPYIKWFKEHGWQVDVAANNDFKNPEECNIPYCDHFYPTAIQRSPIRKDNLQAIRQLQQLIEKEEYQIIHCHTPMGGVVARIAAAKSRRLGTKVLYTAHGFHFYKGAPLFNWIAYYPVERILSHFTDVLITINREDYKQAQHLKARRVEYVPGVGLDLSKFHEVSDASDVRSTLGLVKNDIFAITVGELIKRKNQITLIRAVAKLGNPHFHLFICGDGVQRETLAAEIKHLGLEEQVHLLGFRKDVYRLCGSADLFLFVSLQEGLPVAVMEAMACGLPVICSDIRGNKELITQEKGGYLVNPTDIDETAQCIRQCLEKPEQMKQMKRYNKEKIKKYRMDVVIDQMAGIYRSVL